MSKPNKKEDFTPNELVEVDGIVIDSYKRELDSCNLLEVEVGTTGHMGGDTGHGGRTYFRISDLGCTDMRCHIKGYSRKNNKYIDDELRSTTCIEISFGGDSELDTFCEALRIGYEVLSQEATPLDAFEPTPLDKRYERFGQYINELCELYRKQKNLKGMSSIRDKHRISGLTKQQFYECELHNAAGYVSRLFSDRVYDFILDNTKATPAPKYSEQ